MKNKKFKKINPAINFLLIGLLLFSQAGIAQATSVGSVMGSSNPSSFMDSIFSDLGVDKNKVREQAQIINFEDQKKTGPQVSLFFVPANPDEGEKITVTASPTYFMNDPNDLFYTWFLKNSYCFDEKLDKKKYTAEYKASDDFEKCDLNKDGEVDIDDYKIKATRIIAKGGFMISSDDIYKSSFDNDGYEAPSGGDDQKGKIPHCYIRNTESGKEYELDCTDTKNSHLFPIAKYKNFVDNKGDTINLEKETGDEDFGKDEEKFWHTDPNSNDTANLGHPDEANVVGLGVTSFTWSYQKGDKVGVAVEGVSTEPPATDDSSYKTTWAMNEKIGDFDTDFTDDEYPKTSNEIISTTNDGTYTTTLTKTTLQEIDGDVVNGVGSIKTTITMHNVVKDADDNEISDTDVAETEEAPNPVITYSPEIFSFDDFEIDIDGDQVKTPRDLDNFLYDSLVSPQENTPGSNKLDITLSYSPNNPINDPTGIDGDGDLLSIHASIPNAKDTNYLQYNWKVYTALDISSDIWGEPLLKADLLESTQSVGLGIDTFKFKLGLHDTDATTYSNKYLKVVLTVTENTGEDYPRKSTQDIIIPISSTTEKIGAYIASAVASTASLTDNPSGIELGLGDEICNDDQNPIEKALCPVTKNQIIAISVPKDHFEDKTDPDFLWTIDGKPFTYQYCFFEGCKSEGEEDENLNKQINVAYFPILKEVGEQYAVNLIATNKAGKKINISRNFQVVDPEITIRSADETVCKQTVLGQYFDVNGESFPDYSLLNFWAYTNSKIKLQATTNGFPVSPENLNWEIDGDSINSANANVYGFKIDDAGILTLKSKEKQGESYNISVGTLYTQNNLVKKALSAIWGVTYNQFYEKAVSDDAIITMQDPPETKEGSIKPKKIFATIYSSTPAYLAFLLRIVLTISLILFVTKIVFSFTPQINYREED
ncbi:MAG: hypothetical protein Q7U36_01965 [bacterium]|nr:hypothetical protein [bacterium]